jgi:hypothetical protein
MVTDGDPSLFKMCVNDENLDLLILSKIFKIAIVKAARNFSINLPLLAINIELACTLIN